MPSYSVVTFGCQMNQHDSDRMSEVLEGAGYSPAESVASADLIMLNTCSVREKAEQKLRSEVGRIGLMKRDRPELVIGVAGCVAQQEGEKLIKRMPQIDLVVGPDNIAELPRLLAEIENGAPPQVRTVFDLAVPSFLRADTSGKKRPSVTAFVTTMKGCDERCTFCIVPTTRGPERYRPSQEILSEVRDLVASGVREVTLLGQTVDSYKDPLGLLPSAPGSGEGHLITKARFKQEAGDESEFPALLRALAEQSSATGGSLLRLRYTSPHPRHLTPALVLAHRDLPILARHVHMPVQSGSNRVLRRMARRYNIEEYEERTGMLREAVPGLTLSTDIIVGFPGETREDFDLTLDLIRRLGIIGVFGFKYSERPGTPALKLGDDVTEAEKSERLAELFELSEAQRRAHLERLVGGIEEVLVEGENKNGGYAGRTQRNEIVHFGSASDPTGQLIPVRIISAFKHSLAGERTEKALARPLRPLEPGPSEVVKSSEPARRSLTLI